MCKFADLWKVLSLFKWVVIEVAMYRKFLVGTINSHSIGHPPHLEMENTCKYHAFQYSEKDNMLDLGGDGVKSREVLI